jgi:crotonobetaine/carnitine-CoA ligase
MMHPGLLLLKGVKNFFAVQIEHGTLGATIRNSIKERNFSPASGKYLCDLIEWQAEKRGDRTFLYYQNDQFTFRDMNLNANRAAHGLLKLGAGPRDGLCIWTDNTPAYYDLFYAAQKLGMYSVPTNTALRGNGLAHLLNNSKVRFMVIHPSLIEHFQAVQDKVPGVETVIVDNREVSAPDDLPDGCRLLDELYDETLPLTTPAQRPTHGDLAMLMYTSGTTGLPKGVVYRHGDTMMSMMEVLGRTLASEDEIMYTCLPLFHANALMVTSLTAMGAGCAVGLDKKFSASRPPPSTCSAP